MVMRHFVPIYGVYVTFTRSRKEYDKLMEKADGYPSEDGDNGLCVSLDSGNYIVGVFTKDPGTLAHELAHVALNIVERAGFTAEAGNQEPFCYLLAHLVNQFSKAR